MKRYNKIIFKGLFLAGLIGIFSSCEDFLTRDKPNASTDDDFWQTQQECESALGTCKLWVKGDWGGDEIGMIFQDGANDSSYGFSGNIDSRYRTDIPMDLDYYCRQEALKNRFPTVGYAHQSYQ